MHHLIFEGPELVGKSYLMAQVYDYLEKKYNKNRVILDGCHWFNSDVGVFGTKHGKFLIQKYIEILKKLKDKNVLFEKFHISDIVYNRLHRKKEISYKKEEEKLYELNTKVIFLTVKPNKQLFKKRIKDRLNLYPHYERILQDPEWYLKQQQEYSKEMQKTLLPHIEIDMSKIPNENYKIVLKWLGEI